MIRKQFFDRSFDFSRLEYYFYLKLYSLAIGIINDLFLSYVLLIYLIFSQLHSYTQLDQMDLHFASLKPANINSMYLSVVIQNLAFIHSSTWIKIASKLLSWDVTNLKNINSVILFDTLMQDFSWLSILYASAINASKQQYANVQLFVNYLAKYLVKYFCKIYTKL